MQVLADEALYACVRRAQQNDPDALNEVCANFLDTAWKIAFKRCHDHAEADDATQNAFILVTRFISTLKDPTRIAGWIRQLTIRVLINQQKRRRMPQFLDDSPDFLFSCEYCLLDRIALTEDCQSVVEALQQLPQLDAQALDLFYLQGMSLAEIAALLEKPINTIKRRLCVARRRLRALVEQRGLTGQFSDVAEEGDLTDEAAA